MVPRSNMAKFRVLGDFCINYANQVKSLFLKIQSQFNLHLLQRKLKSQLIFNLCSCRFIDQKLFLCHFFSKKCIFCINYANQIFFGKLCKIPLVGQTNMLKQMTYEANQQKQAKISTISRCPTLATRLVSNVPCRVLQARAQGTLQGTSGIKGLMKPGEFIS